MAAAARAGPLGQPVTPPRSAKARPVAFGVVLFLVALAGLRALAPTTSAGDPLGSQDFAAYWSAWDVTVDGGDPYDEEALDRSQAPLGLEALEEPQRWWNPPWALLVLGPVLLLPFDLATAVWLLISVVAGAATGVLGWRLLRPGTEVPPVALAAGLLFMPFLEALFLGQLSIVVGALLMGCLVCLREHRDVAGGVLLGVLSIKPQSVLLVLVVLGLHLVLTRRWRAVAAASTTVVALCVASLVLLPSAWDGWKPVGGAPTHWRTPTLASWVRAVLPGDAAPSWPLLVVPLFGAAVACAWFLRTRDRGSWWVRVPVLLAASVLLAPFSWVFEAAPLLVLQVLIVGAALGGSRADRALVAALVAVNGLAWWWRALPWTSHQDHIVILLAFFAVAACQLALDRQSRSAVRSVSTS